MIKSFNEFNKSEEIDYDAVDLFIRDNGFGDQSFVSSHGEDFEKSNYYKSPSNTEEYSNQLLSYMKDLSKGLID